MYSAETDLYNYFIVNKGIVKYSRLKNVIDYLSQKKYKTTINYSFYNLLNWGVIVEAEDNCYRLASPLLLRGKDFSLGIQLSNNEHVIFNSFPGVKVFSNAVLKNELEVIPQKFNILKVLKLIPSIKQLIVAVCKDKSEIDSTFFTQKLEQFDVLRLNWKRIDVRLINSLYIGLFKYYPFNNNYFEYYFKYTDKIYKFTTSEVNCIQFLKMYVLLKHNPTLIPSIYTSEDNRIRVDNFFPSIIERQLRINHVLSTGEFPIDRSYESNAAITWQLNRIFTL